MREIKLFLINYLHKSIISSFLVAGKCKWPSRDHNPDADLGTTVWHTLKMSAVNCSDNTNKSKRRN